MLILQIQTFSNLLFQIQPLNNPIGLRPDLYVYSLVRQKALGLPGGHLPGDY